MPADDPAPEVPSRIDWSLVCFGYRRKLAFARSACTRAFAGSLFRVMTGEIHGFS